MDIKRQNEISRINNIKLNKTLETIKKERLLEDYFFPMRAQLT